MTTPSTRFTPTRLTDDIASHSPWMLTHWGSQIAIGFRGDEAYLQRCFNWAHNTSVTFGSLHYPFDRAGQLAYVLVREKRDWGGEIEVESSVYLLAGLRAQFAVEIMQHRDIAPVREGEDEEGVPFIEWDDAAVDKLAEQRAAQFMEDHVVHTNFLRRPPLGFAPTFETVEPAFAGGDED